MNPIGHRPSRKHQSYERGIVYDERKPDDDTNRHDHHR
jgi:hypothetical protein